jgi:hypothetical protein
MNKLGKQRLDENLDIISKAEPDGLLRFRTVHIENLDLSSDAISSTVTFSYLTDAGKRKTHWCFYDPSKYKEVLKEAVEADYTLEVVVARFIDSKVNVAFFGGDSGEIVDWLHNVVRTVHMPKESNEN